MTTDIAVEILKWIKKDSWKESVVLTLKNIKVTKNKIFKILLFLIIFFSFLYIYIVHSTISLAYQYSYDAKVKSQLVSNNYIAESEYYAARLRDVPEDFSKDFVKPVSVVYYQAPTKMFALK